LKNTNVGLIREPLHGDFYLRDKSGNCEDAKEFSAVSKK